MNSSTLRRAVQVSASVALFLGVFGMTFCFPFLWSARIEDLVGAGFPFVGAAVLFGSGLVALALTVGKADSAGSDEREAS